MRPESLFYLFSPITRVKSVGGATAEALTRLLPASMVISESTVPIVRDLLFHLPVGLVDRSFTCALDAVPQGGVVGTFIVKVDAYQEAPRSRFGKAPTKVFCSNDTGEITLVFFGARQDYVKTSLPIGQQRVISGRAEYFDHRLQMTHPDVIAPVSKLEQVKKAEPVYPLTVGLTARRVARIIETAMEKLPALPEWIAPEALDKYKFPGWGEAMHAVHSPQTLEDLSPASLPRMRLAYDEMLARQLHLALLRRKMQKQPGRQIALKSMLEDGLRAVLPYKLTAGQEVVA